MKDSGNYPFDPSLLRTTPLGEERIRLHLHLGEEVEVLPYCRDIIRRNQCTFERKGKNWYMTAGPARFTIHAGSLTIITVRLI